MPSLFYPVYNEIQQKTEREKLKYIGSTGTPYCNLDQYDFLNII